MSDLPFEQWHPDAQQQCGFWWDLSPIACGQCERCRKEQRSAPAVQPPATPQEPDKWAFAQALMLDRRGIDSHFVCEACGGAGVQTYANTSTWRKGIGGNAMTMDVCDACWGSGDKSRPWPSRRASAPPAVWQPIETAPTGTYVLAFWQRFGCYEVVKLDPAKGWIDEDDSDYVAPSHWMPLPSPPTPGGK